MADLEDSGQRRAAGRDRGYRRYQPDGLFGEPADSDDPFFDSAPVEIGADGLPTGVEQEVPGDEPDRIREPFDPESISIETQYVTVDLLLSRLREDMIDLAPDFQRRAGIWSDIQQSRLIESLLLRIPVSSFYMAQQENDDWSVVDGIQRLTAIARFMAPETVKMPPLILRGLDYLEKQFQGKGYQELTGRLRIRLRETQLVVHVIRYGTPEAVKFNVFSRINTGGLPLTRQEIRHAMIPGPARGFLGDLAEDPTFGEATSWSVSNERMSDREMVLRFMAFRLSPPSGYRQQDFDQFLADGMHRINRLSDVERDHEAVDFRRAMVCAHELFGDHAFRKSLGRSRKTPINKALFEAVAVNLAQLTEPERRALVASGDHVRGGLSNLMKDWDFDRAISIATGDPKKVRTRFAKVNELFRGVLSGD
ncbi:DUF262 domain-containing protein [Streptomyces fildesensis]|uniref:DUF262 domain-containing protein n=1 Tax=Streptomyces fildesensis TaxID=375757 RepID=A0ABW8CJM2_9ACTN